MNTIKQLFMVGFALLALSGGVFGQATTPSTTLTANVGFYDTCLTVASTTNMTAAGNLNQPTTQLFIDMEPMQVTTVPSATQVCVSRHMGLGANMPHASGAQVWFGPLSYFTRLDPSGACSTAAFAGAPPSAGNVVNLPLINVTNGRKWTCFLNGQAVGAEGLWAIEDYAFISPERCGSLAATTTTTDNGMVPVATGNVVHQFTTSGTGGTTELTCSLGAIGGTVPLNSGQQVWLGDLSLLYGAQTTAISSIAAATVKSVTYPAPGGSAAGTVAAAGTAYTVSPGTLQKSVTTSGLCYNEQLLFGTPILLNNDVTQLAFDQVFTNSAAVTIYQICGLVAHYYVVPPND